ncbi:unnamed protein product [Tenebrio molitor]|nr:unnamed protein product [Tenebrio molitor]
MGYRRDFQTESLVSCIVLFFLTIRSCRTKQKIFGFTTFSTRNLLFLIF